MANKERKLRDYFNLGMRKLKHRKGFGVHSPFAFAIITEVIEEKLPYYAYSKMKPLYGKQAPTSYKVACLLHRLANRFHCRTFVQVACDSGYTMLPLLLTDSRNHVTALAHGAMQKETDKRMKLMEIDERQYSFVGSMQTLEDDRTYDMLIINSNPYEQQADPEQAAELLVEWTLKHMHEESVIFVKDILPRQRQELFWDKLCDREEIHITMDLYNHGLAIVRPYFFKQHYIVAF